MSERRLTYKSKCGDYGSAVDWKDDREEIYALRNKLGKYEDNEWVSIAKHGNPPTSGCYEVTVLRKEDDFRWTDLDLFNSCDLFGFSINKNKVAKVIAWRNIPEPFDGE